MWSICGQLRFPSAHQNLKRTEIGQLSTRLNKVKHSAAHLADRYDLHGEGALVVVRVWMDVMGDEALWCLWPLKWNRVFIVMIIAAVTLRHSRAHFVPGGRITTTNGHECKGMFYKTISCLCSCIHDSNFLPFRASIFTGHADWNTLFERIIFNRLILFVNTTCA